MAHLRRASDEADGLGGRNSDVEFFERHVTFGSPSPPPGRGCVNGVRTPSGGCRVRSGTPDARATGLT